MKRANLDLNRREIGYQASALLVTALCLLGLIVQAILYAPAARINAAPIPQIAPVNKVHVMSPERMATKFDILFGQPEFALP